MNLINIPDPRTLAETETAITIIGEHPGMPLQLSKASFDARRGALHDAARLQMLITWARHAKDSCLQFNDTNDVQKLLEQLCNYSPGIAAIRLSGGVKVGDIMVTRRDALIPAAEKMRYTDEEAFSEIIKGRCIDMICVSGSSVQFLRPLFYARSRDSVKDKFGMQKLIEKLIKEMIKTNRHDKGQIPPSLIKACGVFCSELFQNTQQHAISDHQDIPYTAHVEGLFISWNQIDNRLYASDFNGHNRLEDFWNRELSISGNEVIKESLRCLQISFFDSGPGFASRITGQSTLEISLADERQALVRCLMKNVTTKKEVGAGEGLPNVLAELRKIGGLIRIRSGRHSIFNAFKPEDTETELFDFQDWKNEKFGCTEGTVISILIPLRKK